MDLNNIPLVGWLVIAIVAYVLGVIVISIVAHRLFGYKIADRVTSIIDFPLQLIYLLVRKLIKWWKNRRDRQLLLATFGLDLEVVLEEGATAENQKLVDQRLVQLARGMQNAFDEQYETRELARTTMTVFQTQQFAEANRDVSTAKQQFWQAHALARRFNFRVQKSYRDYLDMKITPWELFRQRQQ